MEQLFPNLSASTLAHRIYILKRLGITSPTDYSSLKDIDKIKSIIMNGSVSTKKTNGMHIISFLKAVGDITLMNKYYQLFKSIFHDARCLEINGMTKKSDSYLTLKELQAELIKHKPPIKKNPDHLISYLNQLQDYILLSLYILNPPIRNDYANVKIINNKKDLTSNENYLLISSRDVKFYLNKFKNVNKMGPVVIGFTKDTNKFIRHYYNLLKPQYFINSIGNKINPIADTTLSTKISTLSKQYFGHDYSINDYRHIWENDIQSNPNYMNLSVSKREDLHKQLLHSTSTAMNYKIIN